MRDIPIATEKEFRSATTRVLKQMGLGAPWQVRVRVVEKGTAADESDIDCYAFTDPSPNYFYAEIVFDPWHDNWERKEGESIDDCVRHELLHVLLSPLIEFMEAALKGNNAAEAALDQLEEQTVTILERMPIWGT